MNTTKERFNKAYYYLKSESKIKNQRDIAEAMRCSQGNVSLALNGRTTALTNSFILRFCRAFPEFSSDWLLYGTGTMLKAEQPPQPLQLRPRRGINNQLSLPELPHQVGRDRHALTNHRTTPTTGITYRLPLSLLRGVPRHLPPLLLPHRHQHQRPCTPHHKKHQQWAHHLPQGYRHNKRRYVITTYPLAPSLSFAPSP